MIKSVKIPRMCSLPWPMVRKIHQKNVLLKSFRRSSTYRTYASRTQCTSMFESFLFENVLWRAKYRFRIFTQKIWKKDVINSCNLQNNVEQTLLQQILRHKIVIGHKVVLGHKILNTQKMCYLPPINRWEKYFFSQINELIRKII